MEEHKCRAKEQWVIIRTCKEVCKTRWRVILTTKLREQYSKDRVIQLKFQRSHLRLKLPFNLNPKTKMNLKTSLFMTKLLTQLLMKTRNNPILILSWWFTTKNPISESALMLNTRKDPNPPSPPTFQQLV